MNIQISVLLWTVICFLLLMLILQKLLFQPILKCMDARESKIETAKQKKRDAEQAAEEAKAALAQSAREQTEQAKKDAERMISQEQGSVEAALMQKREEEQLATERYAVELTAERENLLRKLGEEAERLGEQFVSGFVS